MAKRYKIGVIGAGARGETFARQLYKGTDQAELFGICDIDEDRLGKFCDYCELTNARRFTDTEAFVKEKDLDAVIVTTPEFTHAPVAIAAMRAGKPVYLEKPLAHTLKDCHAIIETQRQTGVKLFVGFNMRAAIAYRKLKQVVDSGVLGKIIHVDGLEALSQAHGASFMRRFHRHSSNSGGLLNHKCCHDIDIVLWMIGHQHRVKRVSSFGGTTIFTPDKQPAKRCAECPPHIYRGCAYKAVPGFVFPVRGPEAIYHRQSDIYGGDLCVYDPDKDLVDNQTVIMEWDNGVRGTFNLQMFQTRGIRTTRVWGEKARAEIDGLGNEGNVVTVTDSDTGDTARYEFAKRSGGHGGTDPAMVERFINAIEGKGDDDSGLKAGLAAYLIAEYADKSRLSGKTVEIPDADYII